MNLKVDLIRQTENFRLEVQLDAGEQGLALLGAAGSGKTALLRCIAGLTAPDEGRVILDGQVLFDSARRINLPPQKRLIALLPQNYALFPNMTVRQNIAAAVRGRQDRDQAALEKIRQFDLDGIAEKLPRQLSVLERQQAALARLQASNPDALLLDDPFLGLDPYSRSRLEENLAEFLKQYRGAVIWASRDREEVYRNCRYACVLDEGRSQEVVSVEGLIAYPGSESAAKLSGCENFANAVARDSSVFLPDWGVTLRCAYPLPPFLWRVGIRAARVRLSEPGRINAFSVSVVKTIEDIGSITVFLRPSGAREGAEPLRMKIEKSEWIAAPDKRRLTVAIGPQDILLLR